MEKEELRKQWEKRVASYRSSGLTQAKWCEDNHLKLHQLKYWLKRTNGPSSKSVKVASFTPVLVEETVECQTEILKVKIGEASIEVSPGFNASLLAEVVRTLKTLC
jgi:hypothetical protein